MNLARLGSSFLDFLVEEISRGFDIRIPQVSISLGTKFQQNWLGRFRAPASLRKGVDVSAISSVQTLWWDWSRLAYAGVTLFFFFFWSAKNFCAKTVYMKALRHNFKTKKSSRLLRGTKHALALPALAKVSLRINFRVSKPSTMILKLTKAAARPPDPRSSPIPKFLVTPCQSLSLSTWLLYLVSKQSKQGQCTVHNEDLNGEKKQIGLRRSPAPPPAGRNVCKWTVVRVEKQAARCRQIGSFPWWQWQTIFKTARLWTPVTLPFLDGLS